MCTVLLSRGHSAKNPDNQAESKHLAVEWEPNHTAGDQKAITSKTESLPEA